LEEKLINNRIKWYGYVSKINEETIPKKVLNKVLNRYNLK
jgi:hypothetical protein